MPPKTRLASQSGKILSTYSIMLFFPCDYVETQGVLFDSI